MFQFITFNSWKTDSLNLPYYYSLFKKIHMYGIKKQTLIAVSYKWSFLKSKIIYYFFNLQYLRFHTPKHFIFDCYFGYQVSVCYFLFIFIVLSGYSSFFMLLKEKDTRLVVRVAMVIANILKHFGCMYSDIIRYY